MSIVTRSCSRSRMGIGPTESFSGLYGVTVSGAFVSHSALRIPKWEGG